MPEAFLNAYHFVYDEIWIINPSCKFLFWCQKSFQNKILGVLKKKFWKICVWIFFFIENLSKILDKCRAKYNMYEEEKSWQFFRNYLNNMQLNLVKFCFSGQLVIPTLTRHKNDLSWTNFNLLRITSEKITRKKKFLAHSQSSLTEIKSSREVNIKML